ncbi:MAG TPA: hypothetical protein VLM40_05185, partial [Gemmata sp.]|nr:hypothetical protein [Gemmata sp.]
MTDVDLIGYLFDALDPEEQTQVEVYLRSHPDLAMRFDETRLALAPLEADRDQAFAPEGLALRTLARVAAHLAVHQPSAGKPEPVEAIARDLNAELPVGTGSLASPARPRAQLPPRDEPELTAIGGRFRFDILVAGCIALFACGLVFSSIGKLRERNQMVACQNTLRTVHVGLTGYADTHNGQYPRVGVGTNSTAETFVQALVASGQLPIGFQPCCPAAPPTAQSPVSYTYSLGYRAPDGGLVGLRRSDG